MKSKSLPRLLAGFLKQFPSIKNDNSLNLNLPNPFKPIKNKLTGRWQNPIYSLRQQAVLIKQARIFGYEKLFPLNSPVIKQMRGILRWKGTKAQRMKQVKLSRIIKELEMQPRRIETWKAEKKKRSEKDIFL
ncbi:hypothetical protein T552_02583 [Pneumocystis carinii B80]|uniref:Large ribosomal subunit protein mL59 domain-containing protein n=1 Tax=Pneumocystis carinii (strain B80) TaxID=1408658 RepID=A0A0W4ZFC4_PNEC8|nr:hypothetical protein T552_02583 [Pneumocystis carinii B80]KTW27091.1 hypothetical protein T552_02583 [Pneumocystis carinii B80]